MALLNNDYSKVQAQENDFTPLPPGTYPVMVENSEIKTTKAGAPMLVLTLVVCGGDKANRKLWENFVIGHPVADARLKTLAVSGKHPHPDMLRDSEELHGLKLNIRVKIEDDATYGPRNKITGFSPLDGATAPTPTVPATPALPANIAPPTAGKKMPWQ